MRDHVKVEKFEVAQRELLLILLSLPQQKAHLCSSDRSPSHRLNRGRPRRKDEDGVKVGPGRKHVKKEEHLDEGEEGEGGEKDDILCDLCGFATNTSLKLQRHMVAKHGDYQVGCHLAVSLDRFLDFSFPPVRRVPVQHPSSPKAGPAPQKRPPGGLP